MDRQCGQNDTKSFLEGLRPELFLMVLDLLPQRDIASLRLACTYANDIARESLYRDVELSLDYEFDNQVQRFSNLEAAGLLKSVQTLKINNLWNRISTFTPAPERPNVDYGRKPPCGFVSLHPANDGIEKSLPTRNCIRAIVARSHTEQRPIDNCRSR